MALAAGSTTVFSFALIAICILTLLLLRHYLPLRSTPAYLLFPIFLALALPCSIILLVPIDLATNSVEDDDGIARGINLPDGFMTAMWRIAYWLTFVLTWFILPFLGEYVDSGYRDTRARVLDSIRSNIRYQLVVLGSAIAVFVYYVFSNGFHGTTIKGTLIALAYAWGLVLAIYLMGHGLVAMPRRLYYSASISGRLRHLQTTAPSVNDKLQDALDEHDNLEVQVMELKRRKTGTALDFQVWLEELAETSDLPESRAARAPTARVAESNVPHVITERYLADLTRKLKRARHKRLRFVEEWDHLVSEATDLQAILDAASSKKLDFGRPKGTSIFSRVTLLTPLTRYYVYAKILPAFRLVGSFVLALASICIIWSEMLKRLIPIVPSISLVGLTIVHHPNATERGKIGFAGQLLAGAWLCYMCAAALLSIREVKVWGNRALVRRHTYAESACWYAMQVAKLTVPLSYNFITFLPRDIYTQTAFHRFLGKLINFTPLGSIFSAFFPIFILVPVLANLFNLYGRIKRITGFGAMDDDNEDNSSGFGTGGWREGRALLERERLGQSGLGLSEQHSSHPRPPPEEPFAPYADSPSRSEQATTRAPPTASGTALPRRSAMLPASSTQRTTVQRAQAAYSDEEGEEEEGFFQGLAHRVRNTFDTADKPDFKINFTKPKWLNIGDDSNDSGLAQSKSGPLDRLFGGRDGGGGLRL